MRFTWSLLLYCVTSILAAPSQSCSSSACEDTGVIPLTRALIYIPKPTVPKPNSNFPDPAIPDPIIPDLPPKPIEPIPSKPESQRPPKDETPETPEVPDIPDDLDSQETTTPMPQPSDYPASTIAPPTPTKNQGAISSSSAPPPLTGSAEKRRTPRVISFTILLAYAVFL